MPTRRLCSTALLLVLTSMITLPAAVARGGPERPLPATEIYDRVGPSLAFVETPIATGSGVFIEGSYVVTNAHVVWPYEAVRIAFPDGSEYRDVPVFAVDTIADLALLGPIDRNAPTLRFSSREDLPIGSDVYLVGYPLETETFPKPTIARGILSRTREWSTAGLTYFQTDASIAGGQSGGVLVTSSGSVIGISGLASEGSNFGLATSAADLEPLIADLLSGIDTWEVGARVLAGTSVSDRHELQLTTLWSTGSFFSFGRPGDRIELEARADGDVAIYLLDAYGDEISYVNDHEGTFAESLVAYPWSDLRFIQVEPVDRWEIAAVIQSSEPLTLIEDPDDGRSIAPGSRYAGHLDYPFDYDYFSIDLDEGARITITVESVMIDPYLFVDREGEEFAVEDEDSGGGILGLNARITFEALETGKHLVVVTDSSGYLTGGYLLVVEPATAQTPATQFERR